MSLEPGPGTAGGPAQAGHWLRFGLDPAQEEGFRQAHFASDVSRARLGILALLALLVGFAFSDYLFFRLTWPFWALLAVRAAFLGCSALLLARLERLSGPRELDRAGFIWGLALAGIVLGIAATRPHAYAGHALSAAVAVFDLVLFILPNRFAHAAGLSLAITLGDGLLVATGGVSRPMAIAGLSSGFALLLVLLGGAWQLQAFHRWAFLAREADRQARVKAEEALAGRERAEAEMLRRVEELQASNAEMARFHAISVGRELRMIELKREVNELCRHCGQAPRYPLDFDRERA